MTLSVYGMEFFWLALNFFCTYFIRPLDIFQMSFANDTRTYCDIPITVGSSLRQLRIVRGHAEGE